jgi:CheY-like chemotaxis protein
MTLKTCLLVTDDADDHQAMSEALAVVSERTVLLNVIDSQKALLLLKEGNYLPDYIILDLSMHGIKVNSILKVIRNDRQERLTPVIVYGFEEIFLKIDQRDDLVFFNKDYSYTELLEFLRKVLAE